MDNICRILSLLVVLGLTISDAVILNMVYKKSEVFVTTYDRVWHMEKLLVARDGSMLYSTMFFLKRTNGEETILWEIFPGALVPGFKQINSTHIVLAEHPNSCVKMLNKLDNTLKTIAGTCGSSGYVEGKMDTGRLSVPYRFEVDIKNPDRVFVTDEFNNALRAINLRTGELSTVINSNFSLPRAMLWAGDKLLVANDYYISKVSWSNDGTVTNNIIVGSKQSGDAGGDFKDARFYYISDLINFSSGTQLIADCMNCKLKLMDMRSRRVTDVDFPRNSTGISHFCPCALYKAQNELYVAGKEKNIYKLSELGLALAYL